MYAAHSTQRVAGPTSSVAGSAQVDSVQSPPQNILQVSSASAALASAMDSGKFTLTAEFLAATLRKFITGDIDVTVAASTNQRSRNSYTGLALRGTVLWIRLREVMDLKRLEDMLLILSRAKDLPWARFLCSMGDRLGIGRRQKEGQEARLPVPVRPGRGTLQTPI